jgi:hypothetical protein
MLEVIQRETDLVTTTLRVKEFIVALPFARENESLEQRLFGMHADHQIIYKTPPVLVVFVTLV